MRRSATILGASGYAGAELVRLLAAHPALEVTGLSAGTRATERVGDVLPHVPWGTAPTMFKDIAEVARQEADVCFSCLPSGVLGPLIGQLAAPCIVDLSGDHRNDPQWVYGLTEHARDKVAGARRVGNPGCYPTALLLALVPLARADLIHGPVIVDALSGTSGAGRDHRDDLHFSSMHGDAHAYGEIRHRHVPEMERGLNALGGLTAAVSFTPHLVPMARGVLATARAQLAEGGTERDVTNALSDAYRAEPFVTVTDSWPSTKPVFGSNRALVHARVDAAVGMVVVSCAIDNLGKGAAGQAIQNANLALGIEEAAGLSSTGVWP